MQKVFNTFYNRFVDFSNSTSMETKTINKFIKQSIYQKILSVRYSFNSRYMLDEANSPYRWTKSIFRKSFAEMDGKGAILPIIKSRKTFFVCGYDYAICLSNEPRISIELSYGNLKKFKKKKFKYKKKKNCKKFNYFFTYFLL